MHIQYDVDLTSYTTMRLGGKAAYLTTVGSVDDVIEAVGWAIDHSVAFRVIGGGSNIFWQDSGFPGLVIVNQLPGYTDVVQDDGSHLVTIAAGENWDTVVARTVADGLTGIEALSLIPGSSGATVVQNVGAYGQEIADSLLSVCAYDTVSKTIVTIAADDCQLGYRTSRFKTVDSGRFVITSISLQLWPRNPQPPFYRAVADYLAAQPAQDYTPAMLRSAVIAIRSSKLPDPAVTANNGSFFANPVIPADLAARLRSNYPDMPQWPADNTNDYYKIPAAWLIEQAGFKDYHDNATGMATWHAQPLVLVNEHARTTTDLLTFKQQIVDAVQAQFGITLEQEPELLPAS